MDTQELQIKHRCVVEYLDAHDLDAVVLSRRCNFSWYTCGAHNYVATACDAGNSWLVVTRDGARVLTNNIEAERLRGEELADAPIEVVDFPYHDADARAGAFAEALKGLRSACDAPAPGLKLQKLDDGFDRLRWTLTDAELARYRSLCRDVTGAVERVGRSAEPGSSEYELAGDLCSELRRAGCVPWVLLVAGDERISRYRHPLPTAATADRTAMLVTCSERDGLIAACTRIVSFGSIDERLARKHRAVATVDTALIGGTRPGATLGEIFDRARDAYAETGFADEWRLHHQGGSIGYLPREVKAGVDEPTRALERQAFAWNPSITGTKCEDTILCTADGPELLTGGTDWPTVSVAFGGVRMDRPDILVR